MKRLMRILLMTALLSGALTAAPLKVYILAGQSNMQGHGQARTISYMSYDPATKPLHDKIVDPDGTPKTYENVRIVAFSEAGKLNYTKKAGPLTMGYGSNLGSDGVCGPELAFGITMAEKVNEPILIIKTAWGGKSLNTDFRSPSAGKYELPKETQELWNKHPNGAHGIPSEADRPKFWAEKEKETGHYYRLMVKHVNETLADIKSAHPAYDSKQGYEIAGFVWFQGWNDMCDNRTYPQGKTQDRYEEYTRLMSHFIRDVRREFKAPKMPFVIGVIGVDGDKAKGGIADLRPAMAAPAEMNEFKGTVAAVQTKDFWDEKMAALEKKGKQVEHRLRAGHVLGDDGFMEPRDTDVPGWVVLGKKDSPWHVISVDPAKSDKTLPEKEKKRFRDITLPADLKGWMNPEFDDSTWKSGKGPVGKGTWKHRDFPEVKNNSTWPEGEFLLMRKTFEMDNLDFAAYRVVILARQGYHIYLNGKKIHTYIWWQDGPVYRSIPLNEQQAKLLKVGNNVLSIYANAENNRGKDGHFGTVDAMLEGITEKGLEYVNSDANKERLMLKECTLEEARIIMGASNGGYHYLGSGKMLSQIGEAFAKAIVKLAE